MNASIFCVMSSIWMIHTGFWIFCQPFSYRPFHLFLHFLDRTEGFVLLTIIMVKIVGQIKKKPFEAGKEPPQDEVSDSPEQIYLVYVRWSQKNREIKTYMRVQNMNSEKDMTCLGLADLVAEPEMNLNSKNITMAILYQLTDDHDVSRDLDVTGIVPTRLDHYLNSDPEKRITFSQQEIDDIVNKAAFTPRNL